ncbi:hypothetical protein HK099_006332 [Clydaea vesicula]|uniref:Methyltransferase type 11 domain-containing protein n=1 Tax=Clydaea vesicula TaxID=447962 RepID=A0AAD5U655_9FUNG|nr:hypothetical protein HK099_006332 [Clydaea vesicula]
MQDARPSYPLEAIKFVAGLVAGNKELSTTVDLAAGTGKLTAQLVNYFPNITAVEPGDEMRKVFIENLPCVKILKGYAHNIPIKSDSVDAVFIGQAFHWFANVESLNEIYRILKKKGILILIWNLENNATKWVKEIRELYEKFESDTPQYRLGQWKNVFNNEGVKLKFSNPYREKSFSFSLKNVARDLVINRAFSKSYISVLSDNQKEELKHAINEILDRNGFLDGQTEYPYITDVIYMKKI